MSILWKAGLVVAAVMLLLYFAAFGWVSVDALRSPVARALSNALDLPVTIEGELEGQFVPPSLEARDVRIGDLGSVREIELSVDALQLLRRVVYVTELRASGARFSFDLDHGELPEHDDESADPEDPTLELHVRRATLEDGALRLHDPSAGTETEIRVGELVVLAPDRDEPVRFALDGAVEEVPVEISGRLGKLGAMLAGDPLPLALVGRVGVVEVDAQGRIERPAELQGVDVRVEASATDVPALLSGVEAVPREAAITGRLRLVDADGSIGLEDLELRIAAPGPELEGVLEGEVDDLRQLDELDLALRLESAEPALLASLVGVGTSEVGPLRVAARVRDEAGGGAEAGRATPIELSASGAVSGVDFELSGRLGTIAELLDDEKPFAVDLVGSVRGADARVSGSIADPLRGAGVDLALNVAAPNLSWLSSTLRPELDELGALTGSARISDTDGSLGLEGVRVRIGADGAPLSVVASGDLGDLTELDEIELDLRVDARDLSAIGDLFDTELHPIGPVSLEGRARGSDESFAVESLVFVLDRTRFRGSASGSFARGERARIDARLRSPRLRLADVGIDPRAGAVRRKRRADGFRLPTELPELDARVSLEADEVTGRAGFLVDDFAATLVLEREHAALEGVEVRSVQGVLDGEVHLRTGAAMPEVSLELRGAGMRIEQVLAQFQDVPSLSGTVDALIELDARGERLESLRTGISGDVIVVVREGDAAAAYARRLEANLLRAAIARAPLSRDRPESFEDLECGIGRFRVDGGVAKVETFWFETDQVVIQGSGSIDVGRETFDLVLVPKPKRRSFGSVAAEVRVTGPFSDPTFTPSRTSIGTSFARGVLSNITRPVDRLRRAVIPQSDPLVESLRFWRDVQSREDPCLDAFGALGHTGDGS